MKIQNIEIKDQRFSKFNVLLRNFCKIQLLLEFEKNGKQNHTFGIVTKIVRYFIFRIEFTVADHVLDHPMSHQRFAKLILP